MRRSKGSRIRRAVVVAVCVSTFALGLATVDATDAGVTGTDGKIRGVVFTGSSAAPTVTLSGRFSAVPPKGHNNDHPVCGDFPNNGEVFGKKFWFGDDTHHWTAGRGNPRTGSCIGIIIDSWTPTKVVFRFGSAYGSRDEWIADEGDGFAVFSKKHSFAGVVHYT